MLPLIPRLKALLRNLAFVFVAAIVLFEEWGWEPLAFYRRWGNFPKTAKDAKGMKGPALAPMNRQSDLAPALLELTENVLLSSPEYVERIKRHYTLFRGKIDGRKWER